MAFCTNCGQKLGNLQKFCPNCGKAIPVTEKKADSRDTAHRTAGGMASQAVESLSKKVNEIAGGEGVVDLHIRDLFSDVFKKHDIMQTEEIFICGTSKTTPPKEKISSEWPKPWLYSRVGLVFLGAFLLLVVCWHLFENYNVLPGVMLLGSFVMPIMVLIFFFEVNAPKNISFYEIIKVLLVGGCSSILTTLILFEIVTPTNLSFFGAIIVGIVEEIGKAIIVAHFIKRIKKCQYVLNGILIGGTVGAGFAAFESAGYAFTFYITSGGEFSTMMDVIIARGLLAPGGHVAWAAITGAAIMLCVRNNGFSLSFVKNKKFLSLFFFAVALHAVWDMPIRIFQNIHLVQIMLTVIAWVILLVLIHNGLEEINRIHLKAITKEHVLTELPTESVGTCTINSSACNADEIVENKRGSTDCNNETRLCPMCRKLIPLENLFCTQCGHSF